MADLEFKDFVERLYDTRNGVLPFFPCPVCAEASWVLLEETLDVDSPRMCVEFYCNRCGLVQKFTPAFLTMYEGEEIPLPKPEPFDEPVEAEEQVKEAQEGEVVLISPESGSKIEGEPTTKDSGRGDRILEAEILIEKEEHEQAEKASAPEEPRGSGEIEGDKAGDPGGPYIVHKESGIRSDEDTF